MSVLSPASRPGCRRPSSRGWAGRSLRPVQEQAGEALLDGDNAVILAPTAGGKTEAVDVPDALADGGRRRPTASAPSTSRRSRPCSTTRPSAWASTPRWSACDRFVWHGDTDDHRAPQVPQGADRAADDHARVAGGDARSPSGSTKPSSSATCASSSSTRSTPWPAPTAAPT